MYGEKSVDKSAKRQPLGPRARAVACEILAAVLAGEAADRAAARSLAGAHLSDPQERFQIRKSVEGVLFARSRLTWWLAKAGAPETPQGFFCAHAILGGASPRGAARAWGAPDLSGWAELQGRALEDPAMDPLTRLECPPAWGELLRASFGRDFAAEMMAMRAAPPTHVRVNPLKGTLAAAQAALAAAGIESRPLALSPIGLEVLRGGDPAATEAFRKGLIETQDEGSQLAALLADAAGAGKVLDLCAGAGGKTLLLAAQMAGKGRLVAADASAERLARAKVRAKRAGAGPIEFRLLDTAGRKWLKRQSGTFDRVLVDAPCTGTGAWRRNPDARWRHGPEGLAELTARQDALLRQAVRAAAPGGRIIYVTCSVLRPENETRIEALMSAVPGLRPRPVAEVWARIAAAPCPDARGPALRLTPARHGTDGFFIAILERLHPVTIASETEADTAD